MESGDARSGYDERPAPRVERGLKPQPRSWNWAEQHLTMKMRLRGGPQVQVKSRSQGQSQPRFFGTSSRGPLSHQLQPYYASRGWRVPITHHRGTTRASPNLISLNTNQTYHDLNIHPPRTPPHPATRSTIRDNKPPFSASHLVAVPDATTHHTTPPPNETPPSPRQRIPPSRSRSVESSGSTLFLSRTFRDIGANHGRPASPRLSAESRPFMSPSEGSGGEWRGREGRGGYTAHSTVSYTTPTPRFPCSATRLA
ncbi:hypothetical protein F5144DRAFT_404722 [Chaetomium tenue]|uniref:Uncharacterized protein n=1 Tax=Chaetomium tenue TaxID=1854479 RepID=A0ACB7NU32_9PEZI|nr:hypothetical protein F5144DRAFT_404722 [Chaetomium globosum]